MKKLLLIATTLTFVSSTLAQTHQALQVVLSDIQKNPEKYMINPSCGYALGTVNLPSPFFEQAMTDTTYVKHYQLDSVLKADTVGTDVQVFNQKGQPTHIETVMEVLEPSWVKTVQLERPTQVRVNKIPDSKRNNPTVECATQLHVGQVYQFAKSSFVYLEYSYNENCNGSCDAVSWIIEVANDRKEILSSHYQYILDYECH